MPFRILAQKTRCNSYQVRIRRADREARRCSRRGQTRGAFGGKSLEFGHGNRDSRDTANAKRFDLGFRSTVYLARNRPKPEFRASRAFVGRLSKVILKFDRYS